MDFPTYHFSEIYSGKADNLDAAQPKATVTPNQEILQEPYPIPHSRAENSHVRQNKTTPLVVTTGAVDQALENEQVDLAEKETIADGVKKSPTVNDDGAHTPLVTMDSGSAPNFSYLMTGNKFYNHQATEQ